MNLGTDIVTLGGLTVGLAILVFIAVRWWMKQRLKWVKLLPFILSAIYGTLLIAAAGGVLGSVAGITLWGSNLSGDAVLEYGVGGGTPDATSPTPVFLTDGGHVMVLLITIAFVTVWWFSKKVRRLDVGLGILAGICLGLSATWAGTVANSAGQAVNWAGALITGGH